MYKTQDVTQVGDIDSIVISQLSVNALDLIISSTQLFTFLSPESAFDCNSLSSLV